MSDSKACAPPRPSVGISRHEAAALKKLTAFRYAMRKAHDLIRTDPEGARKLLHEAQDPDFMGEDTPKAAQLLMRNAHAATVIAALAAIGSAVDVFMVAWEGHVGLSLEDEEVRKMIDDMVDSALKRRLRKFNYDGSPT